MNDLCFRGDCQHPTASGHSCIVYSACTWTRSNDFGWSILELLLVVVRYWEVVGLRFMLDSTISVPSSGGTVRTYERTSFHTSAVLFFTRLVHAKFSMVIDGGIALHFLGIF